MLNDLNIKQKLLAEYMSQISERCYAAGWMQSLEYVLWQAVINGPLTYGRDNITKTDIEILKTLATESNSWIVFDDKLDECAINLDEWRRMFDNFHLQR